MRRKQKCPVGQSFSRFFYDLNFIFHCNLLTINNFREQSNMSFLSKRTIFFLILHDIIKFNSTCTLKYAKCIQTTDNNCTILLNSVFYLSNNKSNKHILYVYKIVNIRTYV